MKLLNFEKELHFLHSFRYLEKFQIGIFVYRFKFREQKVTISFKLGN